MAECRPSIFHANPLKSVDVNGRVQWEDRERDVEVRFSVDKGLSEKVLRMVSEDILALERDTSVRL